MTLPTTTRSGGTKKAGSLNQYLGPDTDQRLTLLKEIASQVDATPIQVVFAWMLQSTPPVLPLVTAGTREQMDENLGALEVELSSEQIERLSSAGNPKE